MHDESGDVNGDDIWRRLSRRKVVQWGIAYAAAAWGFLQGLSYVTDTFHWPERLQQTATVLLLVGLPVALVLAWYHGDRGAQRVTRTEFAILTLLFVVGGGLFWRYEHAREPQHEPGAATPAPTVPVAGAATGAAAVADARPSIAVLPFENRSSSQDDAHFVDGMHDDILTQLSKLSGLKVISRTSVEQFRGTTLPVGAIATQLGVKSILEGGVQRAGDRVRINVQLIDAVSDAHLWADSYDRELTAANIFAIQSEVATAIAGALKTALTPAEQVRAKKAPTQNLEAWEAYQLGRQRLAKRNSAAFVEAERYFRRAVGLDPAFALAYSGLADTLALRTDIAGVPVAASLDQAQAAADKALELDPGLSEAWTSSGLVALYREESDDAQLKLRRAIELDPNNAMALKFYAGLLLWSQRIGESRRYYEMAAELDPLSAIVQVNLADAYQAQGDFAGAGQCYRRALEVDPTFSPAYLWLADIAAYERNRFAEALALNSKAIELDADSVLAAYLRARLYFDLGDDRAFIAAANEAAERWPDDYRVLENLALADLLQGRTDAALQNAESSLNAYPKNELMLAILRDADRRSGNVDRAIARYRKSYPELFTRHATSVGFGNGWAAVGLALLLEERGDAEDARALLDGAERIVRALPRLGGSGYGIADVAILALRGDKDEALGALREARRTGWRGGLWRYARDFDGTLDSIRSEPEFEAVFADIERDMEQQRAAVAARPKGAPLDLGERWWSQ